MEPRNLKKFLPRGKKKLGKPPRLIDNYMKGDDGPFLDERMAKKAGKNNRKIRRNELMDGPDLGRLPRKRKQSWAAGPRGHGPPPHLKKSGSQGMQENEWRTDEFWLIKPRPGLKQEMGSWDEGPPDFPTNAPGPPDRRRDMGRPRIMDLRSSTPEQFECPRGSSFEHFGFRQRPSPEYFGPPRRPLQGDFGHPRRTFSEHFEPPRRLSPEHFSSSRGPSSENISPPRRQPPERFGPPRRPSAQHSGFPRKPPPEHFGPPRRASPKHFSFPRNQSPENFGPPRDPSPEHFGFPRIQSPENIVPPRGSSPEHFGFPRSQSPENFGPPRGPSPEHFGFPRSQSPENFGPPGHYAERFSLSQRLPPEHIGPPKKSSPEHFGSTRRPSPDIFGPLRRSSVRQEQSNDRYPGTYAYSSEMDDRPRMNIIFDQRPSSPENCPDRLYSRHERSSRSQEWDRQTGPESYSYSPEPHRSMKGSRRQDMDERHIGAHIVPMELSSSRSPSPANEPPPLTETLPPTNVPEIIEDTRGSNSESQTQMFFPGIPIPSTQPMEMMMACQASAWFPGVGMPSFGTYPYHPMTGQPVHSQMLGWANYYYVGQPMVPPLPDTPLPQNPPTPPESPAKQAKPKQQQPEKPKSELMQEYSKGTLGTVQEQSKRKMEVVQGPSHQKLETNNKELAKCQSKKSLTRPWILLNDESSQEISLSDNSDSDHSTEQFSASSSEESGKKEVKINLPEVADNRKKCLEEMKGNVSKQKFIENFDREKLILESTKVKKVGLIRENRVVFVPWNYPESTLSPEQANELAGQLVNKLDSIDLGSNFEPLFESYFVNSGAFVLNCGNEATKIWAKQLATDLSVAGVNLIIATGPDIPTMNVKVGGFFPGEKLASSLVLSILRSENPRLPIEKWSLVEQISKRDGFLAIMKIPKALIPELEAVGFRIRYNKHQVELKLYSDNNVKDEGQRKSPFDIPAVRSDDQMSLKDIRTSLNAYPSKGSSRFSEKISRYSGRRREGEPSRRRRSRSPLPWRRPPSPRRWR